MNTLIGLTSIITANWASSLNATQPQAGYGLWTTSLSVGMNTSVLMCTVSSYERGGVCADKPQETDSDL